MASSYQRNGRPAGGRGRGRGRGRGIIVAGIATLGGVGAMFAYHTSPGHSDSMLTSGSVPMAATGAMTSPAGAQGGAASTPAGAGAPTRTAGHAKARRSATTGRARTSSGSQMITGRAANTMWGIVQVQLTVSGGKIIHSTAVQSPHSTQHSIGINQYALPILNAETVKAGNAKIDSVSGATVTSGGYLQSLQSAVDQAHLA